MKITIKQIEIFIAVAKQENMSHAATKLFISQSACSMALATLENQLNGALFDRLGKRLILNERGRVFLNKAVNIIDQVEELQNLMIAKTARELSGYLKIGASSTIGNYLLPKIIGDFIDRHPNTKISLNVANTEQIISQLLQFEIDIGMIEGHCFAEEIVVMPWKKDQLIIIAAPTHPLSKKKKISLDDLHSCKWILREAGSGTRERFEKSIGGTINPFLELGHTEAIKQAVRLGLGISCLSRETVTDALKRKELIELKVPSLKLTRDFYIIVHKEKYQTEILQAFVRSA